MARRQDSANYAQVTGYVDKSVALRFKMLCLALEVTQTKALEEAVKLWLDKYEKTSLEPLPNKQTNNEL